MTCRLLLVRNIYKKKMVEGREDLRATCLIWNISLTKKLESSVSIVESILIRRKTTVNMGFGAILLVLARPEINANH